MYVKDGHFVGLDPDYSDNGHLCTKANDTPPVDKENLTEVKKQTPQRKGNSAAKRKSIADDASGSDIGSAAGTPTPSKSVVAPTPTATKEGNFGKAHFNGAVVEWKSKAHRGRALAS